MTYHIGQIIPYTPPRGLTGPELDKPVWHALIVPPGREAATRDMLGLNGIHAQYPVREKRYHVRGKGITRKLPVITQVVYAQFKAAPQWDILKRRRLITGVYGYGDRPIAIPYDVVRAVMGLPTVAEELEQARRDMLRVREGDKAEIAEGPLAGFVVDVTKVSGGRAWFETMTGLRAEASLSSLVRKAD